MEKYKVTRFNEFILQEHYQWVDDQINESIGEDVGNFLKKVFQRIASVPKEQKKNILIYSLSSLLLFSNTNKIMSVINSDPSIKTELSKSPELKKVIEDKLSNGFKDPMTMKLSSKGWENIKYEEGDPKNPGHPVLTAYKLGDGRITVGWGHAEKLGKSKFKPGQKITIEQAKQLLRSDAKLASDGVRRMFADWKAKGIERKVTQDQYDALVSMALNMGVSGLRQSDVIKQIKGGHYKEAGKIIKSQSLNKKFGGLTSRRERESDLFLSYLDQSNNLDKL